MIAEDDRATREDRLAIATRCKPSQPAPTEPDCTVRVIHLPGGRILCRRRGASPALRAPPATSERVAFFDASRSGAAPNPRPSPAGTTANAPSSRSTRDSRRNRLDPYVSLGRRPVPP